MAEAIALRGWGWRHPGRAAWAVRGLDLEIRRGESVLLAGPSGAGKSTILLALAGLLDRSGGGESAGAMHVADASRSLVDQVVELTAVDGPVVAPREAASSPAGAPLVTARDVAFRYPAARDWSIDGVDLEVRAGEAVALTGANGSGKSTLALLLAGLLRPARGSVAGADGAALAALRAPVLVRRVGTVFQDPEHQFVRDRADEELMVGPLRTGATREAAHARAAELLRRLRLAPLAAANPFTLSGGEQRRLSVATSLATDPPLLVLDEPTFGQDRVTYAELVVLLRAARDAQRGIVFATHDRPLVRALADREVRLVAGRAA